MINACWAKVARTVKCPHREAQTDKLSKGNQDNDFHLLNKQTLIICPTGYGGRTYWEPGDKWLSDQDIMKTFLCSLTKLSWIYILIPALVLAITGGLYSSATPSQHRCVLFSSGISMLSPTRCLRRPPPPRPTATLCGKSNEMMNLWNNRRVTMMNFVVSLRLIALSTRTTLCRRAQIGKAIMVFVV